MNERTNETQEIYREELLQDLVYGGLGLHHADGRALLYPGAEFRRVQGHEADPRGQARPPLQDFQAPQGW